MTSCRARAPEQRYEVKGKVLIVDDIGKAVSIAHEAIPGYMEAMAMSFKLKDERWFNILAPGNRVQATLVVAGDRSWLEDLVVTSESADTSTTNTALSTEPKPGDPVPDFALVNQDGKRISLSKYKGQALVLTFIYTRCPLPDYCPLMTNQFVEIDKAIKQNPSLYPETHLLSISVDPEFDTPKVLRSYGEQYTGDSGPRAFKQWEFASGSNDEVKKAANYFGLQYWTEEDQIIHSLRTAIIAPDGKLAKLYNGNEWKPADLLSELQNIKPGGEVQAKDDAHDKDSEKIYYGVGVIEEIHKDQARVQINHEDIKDLMPAMSMPYTVKDTTLLDSVATGDRVEFSLVSTPNGFVLIGLKKR
jgi:protein SCO1/2